MQEVTPLHKFQVELGYPSVIKKKHKKIDSEKIIQVFGLTQTLKKMGENILNVNIFLAMFLFVSWQLNKYSLGRVKKKNF